MQYAQVFLWSKGSGINNGRQHSLKFSFVPGSESNVQALKKLPINVAPESNGNLT